MTFELNRDIREIREAPISDTDKAFRLASAFRNACKRQAWDLIAPASKGLLPVPTTTISPVESHKDHSSFTIDAVNGGQNLTILCLADGRVRFGSSISAMTIYNENADTMAKNLESHVGVWIATAAPGKRRAEAFNKTPSL